MPREISGVFYKQDELTHTPPFPGSTRANDFETVRKSHALWWFVLPIMHAVHVVLFVVWQAHREKLVRYPSVYIHVSYVLSTNVHSYVKEIFSEDEIVTFKTLTACIL